MHFINKSLLILVFTQNIRAMVPHTIDLQEAQQIEAANTLAQFTDIFLESSQKLLYEYNGYIKYMAYWESMREQNDNLSYKAHASFLLAKLYLLGLGGCPINKYPSRGNACLQYAICQKDNREVAKKAKFLLKHPPLQF